MIDGVRGEKMAIGHGLRFKILHRDNHTCQYCGAKAPNVTLHIDHIKPQSQGGGHEESNLITACEACNLGKMTSEVRPDSIIEIAQLTAHQRLKSAILPDRAMGRMILTCDLCHTKRFAQDLKIGMVADIFKSGFDHKVFRLHAIVCNGSGCSPKPRLKRLTSETILYNDEFLQIFERPVCDYYGIYGILRLLEFAYDLTHDRRSIFALIQRLLVPGFDEIFHDWRSLDFSEEWRSGESAGNRSIGFFVGEHEVKKIKDWMRQFPREEFKEDLYPYEKSALQAYQVYNKGLAESVELNEKYQRKIPVLI